jgi:hypothetical protein
MISREAIGSFFACSGQAKGARHWSVYYDAPDRQWWRPEMPTGRVKTWGTMEAAAAYAATLCVQRVEYDLAREAAAALRVMDARQLAHLRSYRGIHGAFWGRDPIGLFTADLV